MPLVRSDGVPTQHMRALAYWMAAPGLDGTTSIQVCGLEWVAHVTCRRQLMAELVPHREPATASTPTTTSSTAWSPSESEAVASSKKNALLIDHLAEWIDEQIDGRCGASRRCARGHPVAGTRSRRRSRSATSSCTPATKPVDFEPEKLLREEQEPRLGPGAGPGRTTATAPAPRRRARRGPRLPLRRRPVGDVPAPPGPRARAARRRARWPATPPTSRAGTSRRSARRTSQRGDPGDARRRAPAGSAWRRAR